MDRMTPEEIQAFAKQHGLPDGTTDILSYVHGWLRGYRRAATLWTLATPQISANERELLSRPLVPDSEVQRFYRERIVAAPESFSLTSTELYEEYCAWCEENNKEPFAHPRVTREIGELGVKKDRIGKRTRYFGIALKSAGERKSDNKLPEALPRACENNTKTDDAGMKPLVPDSDVQRFFRERGSLRHPRLRA